MRRVTNTEKEISKQEGKESSIREVAINFINNGVDLNIISNSTGLSIDELNNLKEKKSPKKGFFQYFQKLFQYYHE